MNMKSKKSKIKTKKYRIMAILHSGRKDTRFKKVDADKYNGLIGSTVICKDLSEVKQFECLQMKVLDSPFHRVWETTAIISLWENVNRFIYCETVNSIYILGELEDEPKVKSVKIKYS